MSDSIDLTLLIPAYNEAKRLTGSLKTILQYCQDNLNMPYELLIVDDGSTDQTPEVVKQLQSNNPSLVLHRYSQNRGKGHALKTGMAQAKGKYILFMDADLSTPIEHVSEFLVKLREGMQVVIATRKSAGANITKRQPILRETMGKGFTWLSNQILGLRFTDLTCGFKAFESAAGKDLFHRQKIDGWAYDSEVLFLASRAGYKTCEIPVTWVNSADSKVRLGRDTFTSLISLFQIRWNWINGKYTMESSREPGRIPADV